MCSDLGNSNINLNIKIPPGVNYKQKGVTRTGGRFISPENRKSPNMSQHLINRDPLNGTNLSYIDGSLYKSQELAQTFFKSRMIEQSRKPSYFGHSNDKIIVNNSAAKEMIGNIDFS